MITRSLTAPKPSHTPKEQLSPDSYPARLVSFIHLGTQPPTANAKFPKDKLKIRLTWEFPTEKAVFSEEKGEQPHVLSREFGFSMFKTSALRPFVESMIGRTLGDEEADEFDILSLMEKEYLVTTTINESGYADIQSVIKLPKAIPCPPQINPTHIVLIEDWEEEISSLPEFIQKKIKGSREWNAGNIVTPSQIEASVNAVFGPPAPTDSDMPY